MFAKIKQVAQRKIWKGGGKFCPKLASARKFILSPDTVVIGIQRNC